MSVLHLITRLTLGGSARNTIDQAAATARAGYRTLLATGPSGDEIDVTDHASGSGCEVVVIPSLQRSVSPVKDLEALWETIRLVRRERVQILHTHTSKAGFIGRLAGAITGVPAVVHSPHGHIFYGYYGPLPTYAFKLLERFAARLTDRIVVLTDRGAEEHLAEGVGRREQFVTIPSGVDLSRIESSPLDRRAARARLGLDARDAVLLGIGRLVPIKGFDVLVRALPGILASHPRTRVVLVGDGPEREALETLARAASVEDALTFAGARDDVPSFLAAADLLVAPSVNEGMGRVLVEAMAAGLPVVASRVGGIPSVVADGESGLLVEPGDPGALAAAVDRLLADGELRASMGASAVSRAERFSLRVMESRLVALYQELSRDKGLLTEALVSR